MNSDQPQRKADMTYENRAAKAAQKRVETTRRSTRKLARQDKAVAR